MRILFSLAFVLLLSIPTAYAQSGNPASASDTTSLRQQYDNMLRVSNRYQKFRVVDQNYLNAFIANVEDSIRTYTSEISDLNQTISAQAAKIDGLTNDVQARDTDIQSLTSEKDSMNLLGFSLSKSMYSTVLWTLIVALLLLLTFALMRMRLAVSSAGEARDNSEQLSAELDKAKKRRLEVEQDLRRKLQDEINKNRAK